jgi:guanylate kinase
VVSHCRYGTSLAAVAQVSAAGKHCVLDIDVQGAAQVGGQVLQSPNVAALALDLKPALALN